MGVVLPVLDSSTGWEFVAPGEQQERFPECGPDTSGLDARYLDEFYQQGCSEYTGKVTVPVLWVRIASHAHFRSSPGPFWPECWLNKGILPAKVF